MRKLLLGVLCLSLLIAGVSAAVTTTTTTNGAYTIVKFNGTGTTTWATPAGVTSVAVLVVAGGGGGGGGTNGGGGGAGGLIYNSSYPVSGTLNVAVGAGGSWGTASAIPNNGTNSSFDTLVAIGGGRGGQTASTGNLPATGGSGGGATTTTPKTGAAGTTGQGTAGGNATSSSKYGCGGGGGAGTKGSDGTTSAGGNGGDGLAYTIYNGTSIYYAGGGGGSIYSSGSGGSGGNGGGGSGSTGAATNGTNELGGGGGGGERAGAATGGYGGNGVVILNYTVSSTTPVSSFTENVSYGYPAFTVQFNDTSTNTPTSWNWSFGDGQYSTTQNATHTYQSWIGNSSATYNVSLNATNAAGSNVSANQTKIAYPLTSVFTSNLTSGKPPLTVQFNTTYGNGTATNWAWDFGDTGTSTDRNVTHTYSSAGTYSVTLNVSNAYSYNWSRNASMITVSPLTPPVANFTSNTTSGNVPKTIQFWDNSTNTPISWQWSWGDLTPNGTTQNPTHNYTTAGTYTVILTATNADGSGSLQRTNYITIASGVIPFPGESNTPTNPLGGILYWDVNGNGRIDYNDLVIFFNYLAWAQANEPTWAFDFNSNGRLDYNDVQLLFGRL